MSRSRRPPDFGKCFCGRGHVPYVGDHNKHRGRRVGACPVLEYPHRDNEQFRRFREQRSLPLTEED